MSIKLDDIDKSNGFKVKDNYFDDLPLKIQKRISQDERKLEWSNLNLALKLGGAILPIIIISSILFLNSEKESVEDLLSSIPDQELLAYLESYELHLEDLSEFDVYEEVEFEISPFNDMDLDDQVLDEIYYEYI